MSIGKIRIKTMPKSTSRKVVTVHWHDHASASEWQTLDDIKKWVKESKEKPCVTRGEVVYEDKDVLVLTDGNDGGEHFGNCTLIYRKLIVKKGVKK